MKDAHLADSYPVLGISHPAVFHHILEVSERDPWLAEELGLGLGRIEQVPLVLP